MTVRETLDYIRTCLRDAGIEEFEYEGWVFLDWIFGIRRADYYMNPEDKVAPGKEDYLKDMLAKRCDRVPLQYLMGECEFMGYPFLVDERVLIPRQDTECLVEKALEHLQKWQHDRAATPEILDLCTGSGCIGISIKKLFPQARVTLADISEGALEIAGKNAKVLQAEVALCSGAFCQSLKGKDQVMNTGTPEVIDYKGKALGSEIPAWVKAVSDGAVRKVYKSLELDMNKDKIFVLYNTGNDLDFLKTWTDQVDARA